MTNAFSRSWQVTKLTFSVIGKDKEMLLFPLLGGIFSIILILALLFPTIVLTLMSGGENTLVDAVYLVLTYFGLAYITTFFNVCTVYTAKTRFEGGDATFMDSIKFGFSRAWTIAKWSALTATVGLLLRVLDRLAERLGGAGQLVLNIIVGLLGMAWSIVTIFVVPGLVYYDLGPFAAVKRSVEVLKKTWGESLIRYIGLGLVQLIVLVAGAVIFGVLFVGFASISPIIMVTLLILAIIYFATVILVFNVANQVFNTALFVYAETGKVPTHFNEDVLKHAFEPRQQKGML